MGGAAGRESEREKLKRGEDPYSIALRERMADLADVYQRRREPLQQARQNMLAQNFAAMQPVNAAIGRMYGDQSMLSLNAQNPVLNSGLQGIGNPGEFSDLPKPNTGMTRNQARKELRKRRGVFGNLGRSSETKGASAAERMGRGKK